MLLLKASVFFHDEFFYKMDNINDDYHLFLINNEAPTVFVLPRLVFLYAFVLRRGKAT